MTNLKARISWDDYFIKVAEATAERSNCSRWQVGAVLVQNHHIRGTGYNGPPSGYGHCDQGACPRALMPDPSMSQGYESCVSVHAEANAILDAGPAERDGATLYCLRPPCFTCAKLIANSGIAEVVAKSGGYEGWQETRTFLHDCGVRVRVLDDLARRNQPSLPGTAG